MIKYILAALSILTLMGCSSPEKYDLVIRNVGFFDGYKDRGVVSIAINDDTIAAITNEDIIGDSVIIGRDKFLIPGLVNAHVHASKIEHLQEGYRLGILTVINMHTGLEDREIEWKHIASDSVGFSTLYGSGHAATVPGGHPTQFSPGMETINDSLTVEEWANHRMEKDVDFIKIIREHHEWMGYPPLPTLPYEQIQQLTEYAHSKGYKVLVHANTIEEMIKIAAFKPDGFAHMPDYKEDYPVPDSFYAAMAESGAFIVTTGGIALKSMDGAPPFISEWVQHNLLDAAQRAEIIRQLHERGVLLVAGTDAQEGQMNFSDDYYLELELYKMAGLSNEEIIKTATGNAALAFDLPIGELHIGSKANMVLLGGNPLVDLDNLKKVEQVWKNGRTKRQN